VWPISCLANSPPPASRTGHTEHSTTEPIASSHQSDWGSEVCCRREGFSFLLVLLAFLVLYALTAGPSMKRHSLAAHFVYLAESFLSGRLALLHVPSPPYDLTCFAGRWYVPFPPLPALLFMPLVAVFGLRVSDVALSVVVGALDVALFYLVLKRLTPDDEKRRIWLCAALGAGTPLWYCAAFGSVWYTAHVVAVACLCLYMLENLGRNRPFWAGFWLGMGFLARAPVILAFPLALAKGLLKSERRGDRLRFLLLLGAGMMPALVGQAVYNQARFGNPLEFGYRWINSPASLLARQERWGQFSLHFLPENLYTLLLRLPLFSLAPLHIEPDPWGMGLVFTCPVLLLCLNSPRRDMKWWETKAGLWLSIALVSIPSLLYFNTGSYQFGYRFALDWLPLGLALLAISADRRLSRWEKPLIIVGIVMHLWGVLWMYPNFNGQPWHVWYVSVFKHLLR